VSTSQIACRQKRCSNGKTNICTPKSLKRIEFKIKGPQVVDECTSCEPDLMLFNDAYLSLSPTSSDKMPIEWDITSCQHHEPLAIRFAEGANPWWISLQVINHNYPVLDVWVRTPQTTMDDGNWAKLEGKSYNFFVSNQKLNKVDVRIECSSNQVVVLRNVTVGSGSTISADSNC
jgi:expansin (peptidoglycan-binding protein)